MYFPKIMKQVIFKSYNQNTFIKKLYRQQSDWLQAIEVALYLFIINFKCSVWKEKYAALLCVSFPDKVH